MSSFTTVNAPRPSALLPTWFTPVICIAAFVLIGLVAYSANYLVSFHLRQLVCIGQVESVADCVV